MAPIARIEIRCFRYPLARPLVTVFGRVAARPALIIRLEDADGAHGYGEIWCNFPAPGAEYRAKLAAAVLPDALAGLKSGSVAPTFAAVRERLHSLALQADEPGPADQIASGVDIAVNDLSARRRGVSLAAFLGGAPRPLQPYASGIGPPDAEDLIANALDAGFRAVKLRVGFGRDLDVAQALAARAAIGDDGVLMIDANQRWAIDEALAMAQALESCSPVWLEEPIAADRPDGEWARLAAATSIPLAGGENLRGQQPFRSAIQRGHLAVVQPDICKWGGLSECAPIARAILAAGRRYCPHYLGGGVGLAASAHLLAAVGGDGLLEVDVNENELREALAGPLLPLVDGKVSIPDAPGLGFEPDLDAIAGLQTEYFDLKVAA